MGYTDKSIYVNQVLFWIIMVENQNYHSNVKAKLSL
jgi:hypothetical protein